MRLKSWSTRASLAARVALAPGACALMRCSVTKGSAWVTTRLRSFRDHILGNLDLAFLASAPLFGCAADSSCHALRGISSKGENSHRIAASWNSPFPLVTTSALSLPFLSCRSLAHRWTARATLADRVVMTESTVTTASANAALPRLHIPGIQPLAIIALLERDQTSRLQLDVNTTPGRRLSPVLNSVCALSRLRWSFSRKASSCSASCRFSPAHRNRDFSPTIRDERCRVTKKPCQGAGEAG